MESGTILVADEETTVSVVTAQILESAGFQTICAHDGTSLLRQLSASGPSIRAIVLDVSILDRSGNPFFDLIYGLQPDVPIVMSSGYMRDDVLERYRPGGVFGFIQKPYRAVRLLDAIRNDKPYNEVQSGVGRSGTFYAYEQYGIEPDIMATAKGIGGGFPVGACLATEKAARGMVAGTHGSTYGGNPFAMAAIGAVLDVIGVFVLCAICWLAFG